MKWVDSKPNGFSLLRREEFTFLLYPWKIEIFVSRKSVSFFFARKKYYTKLRKSGLYRKQNNFSLYHRILSLNTCTINVCWSSIADLFTCIKLLCECKAGWQSITHAGEITKERFTWLCSIPKSTNSLYSFRSRDYKLHHPGITSYTIYITLGCFSPTNKSLVRLAKDSR